MALDDPLARSSAAACRLRGPGLLCALSSAVVLAHVFVKSVLRTAIELVRVTLGAIANPVGDIRHGWQWLGIKIGISIWLRALFTLSASRDLYDGVPVVYVNYLDYDVTAHAFGPRSRRALRALRHVDRSIYQLWRVLRRVPEHRYDLYVLSDHGQVSVRQLPRRRRGRGCSNGACSASFWTASLTDTQPDELAAQRAASRDSCWPIGASRRGSSRAS